MNKTLVPEEKRLEFLPTMAGPRYMMAVESEIYGRAGAMTLGKYRGGYWDFYETENGARYMAPRMDGPVFVESPNGAGHELTPDALGIVVTLFALSITSFTAHARGDEAGTEALADSFQKLRDFASEHAEAAAIFDLID